MHELALVQSIIEIVEQEIEKHNIVKLRAIHLSVGTMCCVVPEQMKFCFEILTANSSLMNTELIIRIVPNVYRCQVCQTEFSAEKIISNCHFCRQENPELISGRELLVEFLEVED